jgi:predicted MPP superfamily phosphohydrolase
MLLRRLGLALLMLAAMALGLLLWGYNVATSDPVVRRARVAMPGLGTPLKILLVSDIHVAGPDMPPERLSRIVRQVNALGPDLVLIAGDLVSDKSLATRHYSLAEAVAPLAALKPRLGSFAVLGNHDHWRDAAGAKRALAAADVRLLDNDAIAAGPLAIGGLDDAFTGRDDLPSTLAALRLVPGARLLLSHSPDPFPHVPSDVTLMLAGHTHCGQIVIPLVGALATFSDYGDRYSCGLVREGGKTLIVSAGLGTSLVPLRLGATPDLWLVELRPVR